MAVRQAGEDYLFEDSDDSGDDGLAAVASGSVSKYNNEANQKTNVIWFQTSI